MLGMEADDAAVLALATYVVMITPLWQESYRSSIHSFYPSHGTYLNSGVLGPAEKFIYGRNRN